MFVSSKNICHIFISVKLLKRKFSSYSVNLKEDPCSEAPNQYMYNIFRNSCSKKSQHQCYIASKKI